MENLESIVFVKPKAYENLDEKEVENYLKADQRILSALEGIIKLGEEQLKNKTGYTSDNLPDESPKRTEFSLDNIRFNLITNVKINNPKYQTAFDKITGFLEVLVNDWKHGIRKDGVRTYEKENKEPFVRWDYLMENVLWYLSDITEYGVENKFKSITAPKEFDDMNLERLVIPVEIIKDFNIEKPGSAKIWYLARRFYNDVKKEVTQPVKKEIEKRSGITKENIPEKTQKYIEQMEDYLSVLKSIPSPRREPGKVIKRLFAIPKKKKPKGSKELPIIPNEENYIRLLDEYKELLEISLKKWKQLEGNIGEIVVFYYGIEDNERVKNEFPFLPEYKLIRDEDKMFLSIQALYTRMKFLEEDYKKNRLLRRHGIIKLV